MRKITKLAAIAMVAAVGLILCSMQGCEKKPKTYQLQGTWICIDQRYSENGNLKLVFSENTLLVSNTTRSQSLFDSVEYNYKIDNNLLTLTHNTSSYEFILNHISASTIKLSFTGGIVQSGDAPSGEYTFKNNLN